MYLSLEDELARHQVFGLISSHAYPSYLAWINIVHSDTLANPCKFLVSFVYKLWRMIFDVSGDESWIIFRKPC